MPRRAAPPLTLPLQASDEEITAYRKLTQALNTTSIPDAEILGNFPLFLTRSSLGHILSLSDLYRRIVPVPGVIMEFGVRWGRNLALFHTLRTLYEPYNMGRKVIGFDTFTGFPRTSRQDGCGTTVQRGAHSVEPGYEKQLDALLDAHEQLGPRPHVRRFALVKGDVCRTLPRYLSNHPEILVAMAYFDLDLYEPTKKSLQALKPRLLRGSILVFDQIGLADFPGETKAFLESWATPAPRLQRNPNAAYQAYMVME